MKAPHLHFEDLHAPQTPDPSPQLTRLRRSLRLTQVVAGLALVAAVVPWLTWAQRPDPQDDLLVLEDGDGNRRIVLHAQGADPYIAMYDRDGRTRVRLEVLGHDSRLGLIRAPEGGSPAAGAFIFAASPSLELTTGRHGTRATLSADESFPHLSVVGPDGHAPLLLTTRAERPHPDPDLAPAPPVDAADSEPRSPVDRQDATPRPAEVQDPMERSDACGQPPAGAPDAPFLAPVLSVTEDGGGAHVIVGAGRRNGLALCSLALLCSPRTRGVVVGLSDTRAEVRVPAPASELTGCARAVISRAALLP